MEKKKATIKLDKLTSEFLTDLCEECSPELFNTLNLEKYSIFFERDFVYDNGTQVVFQVCTYTEGNPLFAQIIFYDGDGNELHVSDCLCGLPYGQSYLYEDDLTDTVYEVDFKLTDFYLTHGLLYSVSQEVCGIELPDEYLFVISADDDSETFKCVSLPDEGEEKAEIKTISYSDVVELHGAIYRKEKITFTRED